MKIQSQFRRAATGLALSMAAMAARADVVVVVSAKNPCGQLTASQVSDIFLGNAASFPGGGQAVPLDQGDGAPREEFYGKTVGKSSSQVKAYWAKIIFTGKGRPPKEAGDSAAVRKLVADSPSFIGYIERGAVDASVKVVLAVH